MLQKILSNTGGTCLAALVAVLMGCNSGMKTISITPQRNIDVFGGIEEEYRPTIMKIENEYLKEGYSFLVSPYFGFSSDEYTIPELKVCVETSTGDQCAVISGEEKAYVPSVIMGLDFGLKVKGNFVYGKSSFGFAYISRKFDDHTFQENLHIGLGAGYQGNGWHFGLDFNHWSVGKKVFRLNTSRKGAGINTYGFEFGLDF